MKSQSNLKTIKIRQLKEYYNKVNFSDPITIIIHDDEFDKQNMFQDKKALNKLKFSKSLLIKYMGYFDDKINEN